MKTLFKVGKIFNIFFYCVGSDDEFSGNVDVTGSGWIYLAVSIVCGSGNGNTKDGGLGGRFGGFSGAIGGHCGGSGGVDGVGGGAAGKIGLDGLTFSPF